MKAFTSNRHLLGLENKEITVDLEVSKTNKYEVSVNYFNEYKRKAPSPGKKPINSEAYYSRSEARIAA